MLRSITLIAIVAAPFLAAAQQPDAPGGMPVRMFAVTCVKTLGDPAEFAKIIGPVSSPVDGELAQRSLAGKPGKAWQTSYGGKPYTFSMTDDGLCSMLIHEGQAQAIAEEFQRLGSAAPPPLQTQAARFRSTDGKRDIHTYYWSEAGRPKSVYLYLSIDPDEDAPLRAMLSAAYVPASEIP